jgi:hypothetical protein
MVKEGVIPNQVFWLDIPKSEVLKRNKNTKEIEFNTLSNIIELRSRTLIYKDAIQNLFRSKFANVYVLDGTKSKWKIYSSAEEILKRNSSLRNEYYLANQTGIIKFLHS